MHNRVLVFDLHPERIQNFPEAKVVIGQPDFDSSQRGVSRSLMSLIVAFGDRPSGITIDPDLQRLYVSDNGNHRVLVFDIHPDRLKSNPAAIAVIGQADFESRIEQMVGAAAVPADRRGLNKATPGGLGFDYVYKRLFISQPEESRVLVFDMSELTEAQNPRRDCRDRAT